MTAPDPTPTLRADLTFRLGDTWAAPEAWALVIGDEGVDLTTGWTVLAQARDATGNLLAEWSTADGRVLLGTAEVQITYSDDTPPATVQTSTVQLTHPAAATTTWAPFVAAFDCQVSRGPGDDPERYTLAAGTMRATRDVTP